MAACDAYLEYSESLDVGIPKMGVEKQDGS